MFRHAAILPAFTAVNGSIRTVSYICPVALQLHLTQCIAAFIQWIVFSLKLDTCSSFREKRVYRCEQYAERRILFDNKVRKGLSTVEHKQTLSLSN
jgi:hypothetical protein